MGGVSNFAVTFEKTLFFFISLSVAHAHSLNIFFLEHTRALNAVRQKNVRLHVYIAPCEAFLFFFDLP